MPSTPDPIDPPTILIAGASRGLGFGLTEEFIARGWRVIATVRGKAPDPLIAAATAQPAALKVDRLDVDDPASIARLRETLSGERLNILFVNAGIAPREPDVHVGAIASEEFDRVMRTNALGPMRVIEGLADLVPADGLIGAMSSGQGSVANNEQGLREVYRASKAALNMSMRSFAAREREGRRSMLLLAPGWIRTSLGGDEAPFGLEESVPLLADVILDKRTRPGLEYLDRNGATVSW